RTQKEPFAKHAKRKLLDPLGMIGSGFEVTPSLQKQLALGTMWTYHGREFDAPAIQMGMAPAGNLYSTANDLALFMHFLFADGRGPKGQLLKPGTLAKMLEPQFVKKGEKAGFGLGFFVQEFEGRRRIGHGGAIYGFATEFAALPDDKLGV